MQFPSLNDTLAHTLPPFSIVRFRGMVQDVFEPECYLDVFEERLADGSVVRLSVHGCLVDVCLQGPAQWPLPRFDIRQCELE